MKLRILNKLADWFDYLGGMFVVWGENCRRCTNCGQNPYTGKPCALYSINHGPDTVILPDASMDAEDFKGVPFKLQ